ncbi:MAG: hypothetical protein KBD44_01745 [Candidatus Pacebacteria bacterium]|nr:hypothetical protein [Candidatus Paceibacterota bacterium]
MFLRKETKEVDLVVEPLARGRRKSLLFLLIAIFVLAVPVFVFHAIGYRYDFFNPNGSIISTGALYVTVPDDNAQIYVNDQAVRDARVFRRASYIQYLIPGMHKVHVSAPQLHTWVKELPVYAHMVTEAEAFLLPVRPQLRMVTEYVDSISDAPMVDEEQFAFITDVASTTLPVEVFTLGTRATTTSTGASSPRTQVPVINPEYAVLEELFTAHASSTPSLAKRAIDTAKGVFLFQTTPTTSLNDTASSSIEIATIKTQGSLTLFRRGEEIFVAYSGSDQDIPYYFCVPQASMASTTEVYGVHVMQGVSAVLAATADDLITETDNTNRICRHEIAIDRQGQEVYAFDFVSVGSEAIILHRADGVFVTEIDDRSWQNTQKIYGDTATAMVVENNRVYLKDEQEFYTELLLSLIANNN